MNQERRKKTTEQILNISRLYYLDNLSQLEISKRLKVSRPTISRALTQARETGIVDIKINDPFQDVEALKRQLIQKYHLNQVVIATQTNDNPEAILDALGKVTANYLDEIVHDDDTIGISWGLTMQAVSRHLKENHSVNVRLVQLKGSVSTAKENNYTADTMNNFSQAFHTQARLLPVPVVFDTVEAKKIVMNDKFVQTVTREGTESNIALFTVGNTQMNSMLFRLGYLDKNLATYLQKNSVGDVLSHFVDKNGTIVDQTLDDRTVAISLDDLKRKEYAILVGGGAAKLLPMHAALQGNYANVLVTDQTTARSLLNM
ncbi:sugar-binding transcriptional regulator [Paucilactobacillus nenjiangensis]|uniref:Sugar-binding transcriptional regulator n=2 Tax=Paucilactobacillus nenjiangensis TaxID=1296540 RepID=A0A5P1X2E0_9LACO|nr:sugar-binding transcriptional regulator [Paucilactobacillus nenjiangensis]QER66631.1 sugar-binding transcriptional regulator [Paucilactobacillus nenjiangensis]